jgi:hypothetical protein
MPKFKQLDKDSADLLRRCVLLEQACDRGDVFDLIDDEPLPELCQIVIKRVEVRKLPIKFTSIALISMCAFVDRPGHAMLFLIDCLKKYENQTVTVAKICELYPIGFYDELSAREECEKLKRHEGEWSEIY